MGAESEFVWEFRWGYEGLNDVILWWNWRLLQSEESNQASRNLIVFDDPAIQDVEAQGRYHSRLQLEARVKAARWLDSTVDDCDQGIP